MSILMFIFGVVVGVVVGWHVPQPIWAMDAISKGRELVDQSISSIRALIKK